MDPEGCDGLARPERGRAERRLGQPASRSRTSRRAPGRGHGGGRLDARRARSWRSSSSASRCWPGACSSTRSARSGRSGPRARRARRAHRRRRPRGPAAREGRHGRGRDPRAPRRGLVHRPQGLRPASAAQPGRRADLVGLAVLADHPRRRERPVPPRGPRRRPGRGRSTPTTTRRSSSGPTGCRTGSAPSRARSRGAIPSARSRSWP